MAGLATKVGQMMPNVTKGSSKLLAVPAINDKVSKANIYSKSSGMLEPRMAPWNYERFGYNYFYRCIDGTTKRWNDNTKLIVVEGPPGLEKTKFAKELAEELDMLYVDNASMDHYYINKYGYDLRDLAWHFTCDKVKPFDEKNFVQDPTSTSNDGAVDRMMDTLQVMRAFKYNHSLTHLMNTGQGVVTEKSPFSDYVFTEACYEMGWIDRTTRNFMKERRHALIQHFWRPNLIIHLDAPVDVVQAKIKARAATTHPWEKNSPVYASKDYMKLLYEDLLKDEYLKEASVYSKVLTYDWSEGGVAEIVVEDIERLNLDYFEKYDKQQIDWRRFKEDHYSCYRQLFTDNLHLKNILSRGDLDADKLNLTFPEKQDFFKTAIKLPGNRFNYGYNRELGDKPPLIDPFRRPKMSSAYAIETDQAFEPLKGTLFFEYMSENLANDSPYWKERARRKAAGEANWWNF